MLMHHAHAWWLYGWDGCFLEQVVVSASEVAMSTTLPTDGALLLHWGLQVDGADGWVLPEPSTRPRGTQQYKERALQVSSSGGLMD